MSNDKNKEVAAEKGSDETNETNQPVAYEAVGHIGKIYVFHAPFCGELVYMTSGKMKGDELRGIIGPDRVPRKYYAEVVRRDGTTDTVIKWSELADDIILDCQALGHPDLSKNRKAGVSLDPENPAVVLVNDVELWDSDGNVRSRSEFDTLFIGGGGIGVTVDTEQATDEDAALFVDTLASFNYKNRTDYKLLAGYTAAAVLCGALEVHPHCYVTGTTASGKSKVQALKQNILGNSCVAAKGNTSEPAVRQKIDYRDIGCLFDEAEGNDAGSDMARVIEFARQAFDGEAENMKGTSDQKAIGGVVRSPFLFTMVNVPALKAADQNRCVQIELKPLPDDVLLGPTPELLKHENKVQVQKLGKRLRARIIRRWPTYRLSNEILQLAAARKLVGKVSNAGEAVRISKVISTLLAGYWVLQNDTVITEEKAKELVAEVDYSAYEDVAQTSDEYAALDRLLSEQIRDTNGITVTIADLMLRARGSGHEAKAAVKTLRPKGVTVTGSRPDVTGWFVGVSSARQTSGLLDIYRGSPWANGGWSKILPRLPGADKAKAIYFSEDGKGFTRAGIYIPWDTVFPKNEDEATQLEANLGGKSGDVVQLHGNDYGNYYDHSDDTEYDMSAM